MKIQSIGIYFVRDPVIWESRDGSMMYRASDLALVLLWAAVVVLVPYYVAQRLRIASFWGRWTLVAAAALMLFLASKLAGLHPFLLGVVLLALVAAVEAMVHKKMARPLK